MGDEYRIDSHKLMFHPERVAKWLSGEVIYPVYMELSPSGDCNHRCTFCALDYVGYQKRFLETALLKTRLSELGQLGVRSIMLGGEGEPLLHSDIMEIILHTKASGIDTAITTNGFFLTPELAEKTLDSISWIKVSLNAGTADTYAKVHGTKAADFERVFENLAAAVAFQKQGIGRDCAIGAQMILLPENAGEAETLAERAREAGLRYLVIKPYSQHHKSRTRRYEKIDYSSLMALKERLARFNGEGFQVIVRTHTMEKMQRKERGYERCLALPFWSYIDSAGNVWGCSAYLGDDEFRYGNIYEHTFREIWEGERRKQHLHRVESDLDPSGCRINCRMDEVNFYLWELTHPSAHVNFI